MSLTVGNMFEQDTKSRSKSSTRQNSKPASALQFDKQISNKNYIFDDQHLNPLQNNNTNQHIRNQSNENILIYGDRIHKPGQIYNDQIIIPNSNAFTLHPGPSNDLTSNRGVGKPPLLVPISKSNYQARTKVNALPEGLQEVGGPLVNSARRIIKSEHSSRNRHDTSYERREVKNLGSDKRSATPLCRNEEAGLTLEERFQLLAYGGLQYVPPDTRSRTPIPSSEPLNTRERAIKAKMPAFSKKLPPSLTNRAATQLDPTEYNEQNFKTKYVSETTQVSDIDLLRVTGLEPSLKPQTSGKNITAKQISTAYEEKKREKIHEQNFKKYKPPQYLDKGRENQNVQNMLKESPRQQRHPEELNPISKIIGKRNSFDHAVLKSPRNEELPQINPKQNHPKQIGSKLPPTHNNRSGKKRVSSATQKSRQANQSLEEKLESELEVVKNRDLAAEILMNNVDVGGFDGWGVGGGAEEWEAESPLKLRSSKI